MNAGRLLNVAGLDLAHNAKRPLFWIFLLVLGLMAWGLAGGNVRIASGESEVGGTKAWLTSEFAISQMFAFLVLMLYGFFVSVAAGMSVIQDDDDKVGPLLHATPLKPSDYFYGKLFAVMVSFTVVLLLHVGLMMFFNHVMPTDNADEIRGPFALMNYVKPALLFGFPVIVFFAGVAFAVGTWTRRAILVTTLPLVVLLTSVFFLWDWSPSWLDPKINQLLMALDPAGFRWLNETWLKVDRGVEFYNSAPVGLDAVFIANRLVLLAVGLLAPVLAFMHFSRSLRGESLPKKQMRGGVAGAIAAADARASADAEPVVDAGSSPATPSLSGIGMSSGAPGFLGAAWTVARAEIKELRSQPGLYIFAPLIILQVLGQAFFNTGAFDTPLLHTSGTLAAESFGVVTTLVALLLLFYTVETMEREQRSGFVKIFHATPVRTGAILLGKAAANVGVVATILLASFVGSMIALAFQGQVPLDPTPFLILYGGFLLPTFFAWTAFLMAVQSLVRNRYTTYGIALGVLIFTGWRQGNGEMNWVGNWPMWGAVNWSDMSFFELNGEAMLLNRLFVLGLGILFIVFTARVFSRADRDIAKLGDRLRPPSLLQGALRLAPFAVLPVIVGSVLYVQVQSGFQSDSADKQQKDYWRRNLATWRDSKYPGVTDVDLALQLDPAKRWMKSEGTYTLVNHHEDETFPQVPLTRGFHWENLTWTMNGETVEPDDRVGLVVFTPASPMTSGDTLRIGWSFEGRYPKGFTKNGSGAGTFVLPSSVVLTSFEASFVPVVGYLEGVGIDEENEYDAKEWDDDFYEGITDPAFGAGKGLTTRIAISGPEDYVYNSVGVKVSETVEDGRRSVVWESDHPVKFFNVVAGKWNVHEGDGTAIYYHASHTYNIDEMGEALDGARKYFSEWFHPYPWKELKVSEFPALAGYAQGFPTNITFSEGIGFLTKSDERANAAFMVTAHEAAHQWWGNILLPGNGPGGNILSEGMAHFSTILLFDQVKGAKQRIEFCKRLEERYADNRRKDSERPLVKIDGTRPGDTTVQYDKGGWVAWMLLNHMGRERALAGLQEFIREYSTGVDHPVLQDLVAVMRRHADDVDAYDAFVNQWFFDVVFPEYRLADVMSEQAADAMPAPAGEEVPTETWNVSFTIENYGTGTMPVEIAAFRGERFPKEGDSGAVALRSGNAVAAASDAEAATMRTYQESRRTVVLAPGEKQTVTITCRFEPEKVIVDPDTKVLQLNREQALAEL